MALSTGQVNNTFQDTLGRAPTGAELAKYTSDTSFEGSPGQVKLAGILKPSGSSGTFSSVADANAYLNKAQTSVMDSSGLPAVQTPGQIMSDLQTQGLLPTQQAPTAPNLVQTYQDLAKTNGLDKLSADITDLKGQQDELAAQLRVNKTSEQGKPVPTNVIEGRISQQTQQNQDQQEFLGRQLSRKVDEYNSALTNVKNIMDLTQQDYGNAVAAYTTQFNQAITTINTIQGIQNNQKDERQKAIDNARANLQIYVNTATAGNLDYSKLAPDQQAKINQMEMQAGLPVGFISSIKIDPKQNIVATTESNGQIQVLMRNSDGSMKLQTYGTQSTTPTQAQAYAAQQQKDKQQTIANASSQVKAGATLQWLIANYTIPGGITVDEAYALYNANSKYGQAKESLAQVKQGVFATQKGFKTEAQLSAEKTTATEKAKLKAVQ